jgi:hypothetical protein
VCAGGWQLVRGMRLGTVCAVIVHLAAAAIMADALSTKLDLCQGFSPVCKQALEW